MQLFDAVALLEDVQTDEGLLQRAYAFANLHAEQLLVLHNQGKESVAA